MTLPGPVTEAPTGRAPDLSWQRGARAAAVAAVAIVLVISFAGAVHSLWLSPARGASGLGQGAPTMADRMTFLATSCVRDWANYDAGAPAGPWRERLSPCFTLTPTVLADAPDPTGAQVAAEPLATVVRRSHDGRVARMVVRLRVTGPRFAFYQVDVGCRPDGACSLTTLPAPVSDMEGTR